jgi:hypothetical protein
MKCLIEFDENIITGDCLQSIVDCSYSGKINITEDNVFDLLLAADYFDIRLIKTECEKFLGTPLWNTVISLCLNNVSKQYGDRDSRICLFRSLMKCLEIKVQIGSSREDRLR